MNRDAQMLRDTFDDVQWDSDATAPLGWQPNDDDMARSKRNILLWESYLPKDCVDAMIRMGWDIST